MKSRKKKFIDIDIKKHEYFKKWKSINVRGNIRLISKLKIDYIILNNNHLSIYIYNKVNLTEFQKIILKNIGCFILNQKIFLIQTEKETKIYSNINNTFNLLKTIKFPEIREDSEIINLKNENIIISTYNNIQIWNTINSLPSQCITIIDIYFPQLIFLMNNEEILVINEREEFLSFWNLKELKMIKCYENYCIVCKIDEERILLRQSVIENLRGEENFINVNIIKIPKFNIMYNFENEEFNLQGDFFVFKEKNIFIYYNNYNINIYNLSNFQSIDSLQIFGIKLIKVKEDCCALIKYKNNNFESNDCYIQFYKIN